MAESDSSGDKGPVRVEDIETAEVPEPSQSVSRANNEQAMFAHEQNMQKSKLGWVGAIWGSKAEKPGNIAAIVLIVLLIFVGATLWNFSNLGSEFSDVLALLMSTITLILGYLFGSSSKD